MTAALTILASTALYAAETVELRRPVRLDLLDGLRLVEPTSGPAQYQDGYELDGDVYKCDVPEFGANAHGVALGYELNQTTPKPLVAVCSSKGENVSGNVDSGYSIYVDLHYDDGSPLWGQTYSFPVGDSDWKDGKVVIFPSKPVKSLALYAMFRGHTGVVSFKNLALYEYDVKNNAAYFDRVATEPAESLPDAPRLIFHDQSDENASFYAAADLAPMESIDFDKVEVTKKTRRLDSGLDEIVLNLRSKTQEDVVFSLYYALPIPEPQPGAQWVWFDDPRNYRTLSSDELRTTRGFPRVGSGELSKYPFGVVAERVEKDGVERWGAAFGIALDPEFPAFYRIAANGATRELYVAYDLALTREKPEIELRLALLCWRNPIVGVDDVMPTSYAKYVFSPSDNTPFGSTPLRAAFDVWRQSYPDAFRVRALEQGNWMAFAKISNVPNPEDFGFVFKEGIDETEKDDALGISSFRYTEPMTWWQQVEKSETSPKTRESALAAAKELAIKNGRRDDGSPVWATNEARALFSTGMHDEKGRFSGMLLDTPWCDGVVWSMNDAPGLVELVKSGKLRSEENEGIELLAGFEIKWSEEIANKLYGRPLPKGLAPRTRDAFLRAQAQPGVDGEYVDSSEGYVTAELDFTRAFFEAMTTPLTFDAEGRAPAIFRGLVAYEYVRRISEDVHARSKLIMANATPSACFWLAPVLDVLGTETNWNHSGGWRPMTDDELMYRRLLAAGKPYCFLMNTDFSQFSKECSERYMKRALAYGMFPSFFSADASTKHYFENPELYERDRELFKRYMPIVKKVAQAGWEPEPSAKTNDPKLYVERFGAFPTARVATNPLREGNTVYLTLFNDSDETKDYEIALSPAFVQLVANSTVTEELSGAPAQISMGAFVKGSIEPQDVKVFKFEPQR